MAVVFAVAMLSGVVGNVGTVKTQAAEKFIGTIGQTDFDYTCYMSTVVGVDSGWKYSFASNMCKYTLSPFVTSFTINWDEVCRWKYDKNRYYFPWERSYAKWKNCYRQV